MSEFTKGQWIFDNRFIKTANFKWNIAALNTAMNDDEVRANGHLIAAAPKMFRLLDTISYLWDSGAIIDKTGTIRRAQELIARIDGEEE